jgi:hypothetical protein
MSAQVFAERLRGGLSANGTGIILVVSILVVLIVLAVGTVYVLRLLSPKGKLDLLLEGRAERAGGRNRWVPRIIITSVVLASLFGMQSYLWQPATCASCHRDVAYNKTLRTSVHRDITCADCHRQAGPGSLLGNAATYARWGWAGGMLNIKPKASEQALSVQPSACLRCHNEILNSTMTVNGIRVRHSDFVGAGSSCIECHGATTHQLVDALKTKPTMNKCIPCHDGKRAPSKCTECHTKDFGVTSASKRRTIATVNIAGEWNSCYTCHAVQPCSSCHGVVMPHPPGFVPANPDSIANGQAVPGSQIPAGSHARDGFQRRELCWRCHHEPGKAFVPGEASCRCHGLLGSMHGGQAWVKEHGLQATGVKAGTLSGCSNCHSSPESFCTFCHDPSMALRYNPLPPGPDTYTRDQPQDGSDDYWIGP